VHDAPRVRGAERAGDLDRVGDRLVDRQAPHPADAVLERLALDELEDDVRAALVLARVDHADDVRVRELGHRAGLAPEARELVGVRGDLPVHELDRDPPLERRVERPVDGRHPAGAHLGVEPVPTAQLHPHERAHPCGPIVADVGVAPAPISVTVFTDPFCPWSWAAEPQQRRLEVEFGTTLAPTFVIVGLRRQIHDPGALALESLDAAAESGMPVDPRVFLRDPPSSTHPAGLAVAAVSEQAGGSRVGRYLRRLREAILLEGRRMDTAPALLDAARETGGLDLERLRVDFGSNAIVERFGADIERARAVDAAEHAPGADRVRTPSVEFLAAGGAVHGVYGYAPYEAWREAAIAAGAQPAAEPPPAVEDALRRFGTLTVPEVAAACGLPGPRASAELWRLALEWRARPRRVLGGELWAAAA
jgi:predicted DsbA family dithiol-disulfide isomerase